MADIFEYLDFQAEYDNEPMRKAAAIAVSRSESVFAFLKKASSKDEFDSRLALVEDNIQGIVNEACEEFGYNDPEHIAKVVQGQIELLAAEVETGDNYYQRRDELPTAPADGSLSEPSPKLDPNKAGDQWHTFQDEPKVDSVRNRADRQDADQKADYAVDMGEESGINHPLVNRVDADKPMQPEFNVGDNTKTFPNKNQAQPVSSARKNKKTALWNEDEDEDEDLWNHENEEGMFPSFDWEGRNRDVNPSDVDKQSLVLEALKRGSPDEAKAYLVGNTCLNSQEADILIQHYMSGSPSWGGPLHHGKVKKSLFEFDPSGTRGFYHQLEEMVEEYVQHGWDDEDIIAEITDIVRNSLSSLRSDEVGTLSKKKVRRASK